MTNTTVNASENPNLVNNLVKEAMKEPETAKKPIEVLLPNENVMALPGGYLTPTGDVIREYEVRELTGRDEEAIARTNSLGKALLTILSKGTVRIGDEKATETLLDNLLVGDRDAIMLSIYRATFGDKAELDGYCNGCNEYKPVTIDVIQDIKVRPLINPIDDRMFEVDCKVGTVILTLPTGKVQKELVNNADKTTSELTSILLENCVVSINGVAVMSKAQIQNLGIQDRKKIGEAIADHAMGPIFEDIVLTCPDCESEVRTPINLGTLFRF
jgi:hypothetical protein